MYQIPEEKCDLEPKRSCKHVTTLVPKLQPSEECVDVPKEVKGKYIFFPILKSCLERKIN